MKKFLLVFDYFKEVFEVNRNNKLLYKPQIIMAIIKALIVLGISTFTYLYIEYLINSNPYFGISLLTSILLGILGILGIITVLWLVLMLFESGFYYMYFKSLTSGTVRDIDFWDGVRKYFLKFIIVDIMTKVIWIFVGILTFIAGILTLGVGFVLVPIAFMIFISMWKVSIVYDNCGIFEALGKSMKFAGRHFIPFSLFMLITFAFTSPIQSYGWGNGVLKLSNLLGNGVNQVQQEKNSNIKDLLDPNLNPYNIPNDIPTSEWDNPENLSIGNESSSYNISLIRAEDKIDADNLEGMIEWFNQEAGNLENGDDERLFKGLGQNAQWITTIAVVCIVLLVLGTLASSLIMMIFQVFFGLAMFVVYKHNFNVSVPAQEGGSLQ